MQLKASSHLVLSNRNQVMLHHEGRTASHRWGYFSTFLPSGCGVSSLRGKIGLQNATKKAKSGFSGWNHGVEVHTPSTGAGFLPSRVFTHFFPRFLATLKWFLPCSSTFFLIKWWIKNNQQQSYSHQILAHLSFHGQNMGPKYVFLGAEVVTKTQDQFSICLEVSDFQRNFPPDLCVVTAPKRLAWETSEECFFSSAFFAGCVLEIGCTV